jgi:hypothetical protein
MKYLFAIIVIYFIPPKELHASKPRYADVHFVEKIKDFGLIKNDTVLVAKYRFVNTGNSVLIIDYVNPDCTCTSYYLSQKRIMPNDTAYIELKFDTRQKMGSHKLYAVVATNTVAKFYKLTLKVDVVVKTPQ